MITRRCTKCQHLIKRGQNFHGRKKCWSHNVCPEPSILDYLELHGYLTFKNFKHPSGNPWVDLINGPRKFPKNLGKTIQCLH